MYIYNSLYSRISWVIACGIQDMSLLYSVLCGALLQSPPLSRRHAVLAAASSLAAARPLPLPAAGPPDRRGEEELVYTPLADEQGNLVVDPSRDVGAYATISAALEAAPSGATVIVRPGVYTERVMVRQSVTLKADPGVFLVWESDKPYEATLTIDLRDASAAADVLVSGLMVTHYSPSIAQNYAVYVPPPSRAADASKVELRFCDVCSRSGTGVGVEGGFVAVVGCRVHDCKNHGLAFLGPGARGVVQRCSVEACKLDGVLVRDGAAPMLEANRFNANQRFGAELVDARCDFRASNEAKGNGKGAIQGECDVD